VVAIGRRGGALGVDPVSVVAMGAGAAMIGSAFGPTNPFQAGIALGVAAVLMVPFHALIHVPVSSVSGQAALTMPVVIPLSDLLGLSRQAAVLAYQTGGGLAELSRRQTGR
jgi:uncharacterized ion transporter superfamily protein YfcC